MADRVTIAGIKILATFIYLSLNRLMVHIKVRHTLSIASPATNFRRPIFSQSFHMVKSNNCDSIFPPPEVLLKKINNTCPVRRLIKIDISVGFVCFGKPRRPISTTTKFYPIFFLIAKLQNCFAILHYAPPKKVSLCATPH